MEKYLKNLEKYLGKVAEIERKDLDYLLNNAYSEQHGIAKSMNMILNLIIAANITSFLYLTKEHFFYLYRIDSWIGITCSIILSLTFLGSFICAMLGAYSSIEFIQSERARSRHLPKMENTETAIEGAEEDGFYVQKLVSLIENQREAIKKNKKSIGERQKIIIKTKNYTKYALISLIWFLSFSGCIILGKERSLSMAQDENKITDSQAATTKTPSPMEQLQNKLRASMQRADSYNSPSNLGLESDTFNRTKTSELFLENTNEKDD